MNFDLIEKSKREAKEHELKTSNTWKVSEENWVIAEREFLKQMWCEKGKKTKEEAWKKWVQEVQQKRWDELWKKEEALRKEWEEAKAAADKAKKGGGPGSPSKKPELWGSSPEKKV